MNSPSENPPAPEPTDLQKRGDALREALLRLHKSLLESERVTYEKTFGPIQSPNHFLKLLTTDPWFAWLRPLSKLIIELDDAFDKKNPNPAASFDTVIKHANELLVANKSGEDFAAHYDEALQRDPDVVLAQSEVAKLIRPPKGGSGVTDNPAK